MILARDLYIRCLEADPGYAPAWARLGRVHRFIGKFGGDEEENLCLAEQAFQRSFSLNADLALAHNFYTSLQADLGRALDAMERLLKRAEAHRNDPDLFTGLIQACRYCGLFQASVAAHERARVLDPQVKTSVSYTYRYLNNPQAALDHCASADEYAVNLAWVPGREEEALRTLRERANAHAPGSLRRLFILALQYDLEGDRDKSLEAIREGLPIRIQFRDPEARFGLGVLLTRLGKPQRALQMISQALEEGYFCHHILLHHPWLDSLRSQSGFPALVSRAAERSLQAKAVFLKNGGDRLFGVPPDGEP